MLNNTPLFDLFWENSKLNKFNIIKFTKKLSEDARILNDTPQLFYSTEDLFLKKPYDKLSKTIFKRESSRVFSRKPISEKQMGSLFFAFSQKNNNKRVIPSGGGKYPIEVFAFLFNVKSKLNRNIVYYNTDHHSLSIVNSCPAWDDIKDNFGLYLDGTPAILFVFVGVPERITKKYGERGGRFLLIETGHYAQNLSLRLVVENLVGVEAGGLYDDTIKNYLKLEKTNFLITLGYACGSLHSQQTFLI